MVWLSEAYIHICMLCFFSSSWNQSLFIWKKWALEPLYWSFACYVTAAMLVEFEKDFSYLQFRHVEYLVSCWFFGEWLQSIRWNFFCETYLITLMITIMEQVNFLFTNRLCATIPIGMREQCNFRHVGSHLHCK